MQRSRQMVFVSGAPGAGKSSLAVPLAAELGFALVCKDKLEYDRPVGIGKLVRVNTATPVDVPAVAAAIRAQWPRRPDGERCE